MPFKYENIGLTRAACSPHAMVKYLCRTFRSKCTTLLSRLHDDVQCSPDRKAVAGAVAEARKGTLSIFHSRHENIYLNKKLICILFFRPGVPRRPVIRRFSVCDENPPCLFQCNLHIYFLSCRILWRTSFQMCKFGANCRMN